MNDTATRSELKTCSSDRDAFHDARLEKLSPKVARNVST